jgi:hypothetical protein
MFPGLAQKSLYFYDLYGITSRGAVAQIPFRSLKRIFDHSKVCFTANLKLALWAQTLGLRPFRFTKNRYQKFFNVRSRRFGQQPVKILPRHIDIPHSILFELFVKTFPSRQLQSVLKARFCPVGCMLTKSIREIDSKLDSERVAYRFGELRKPFLVEDFLWKIERAGYLIGD